MGLSGLRARSLASCCEMMESTAPESMMPDTVLVLFRRTSTRGTSGCDARMEMRSVRRPLTW